MSNVVMRPGLHVDWLAVDATATSARLVAVLGRAIVPGRRVRLPGGSLRVTSSPGAGDERLGGLRVEELASDAAGSPAAATPMNASVPGLVAVGWATIDLDRATAEVGELIRAATGAAPAVTSLPDDRHLGARARALWVRSGGPAIVLLEPTTEGRLAATLARFGEGPAGVYLGATMGSLAVVEDRLRAAGMATSGDAAGPFGRQVLAPGPRPWGPHLVVSGYHRSMNDESLITVRAATDLDAPWMATLFSDEGYPAGPSDVAERLEHFAGPNAAAIVAEIDGEPLGFIAIHVLARLEAATGFVRVVALVVDPGARERGVGRLLMEEAERIGREAGAAFIEVTAGHHRPDARRLYESLGYDASVTTYLRKRL